MLIKNLIDYLMLTKLSKFLMALSFDTKNLSEFDKKVIEKHLRASFTQGLKTINLSLFRFKNNRVFVPFYFGTKLQAFTKERPFDFSRSEEDFRTTISLREEQKEVLLEATKVLEEDNAVLLFLPTGFGKTVISIELSRLLPKPIFVLVHRLNIQEQWLEAFKSFLCNKEDLGKIFIGTKTQLEKFLESGVFPRTLIVDECHCFYTQKNINFLLEVQVEKLVFLSATPFKESIPEKIPYCFVGKNIIRRQVDKKVTVFQVDYENSPIESGLTWPEKMKNVLLDENRDLLIKKITEIEEDKILILTALKDQARNLNQLIENSSILIGSTPKTEDSKVLIGTVSKLGIGFDPAFCLENFDKIHFKVLVIDCTFKLRTLITQIIGRVLREDNVRIYQICDSDFTYRRHWGKIKKFYMERNFRITRIKLEMNF
jgi:superfamily II DNA or RNA helicase